MNTNVAPDPVAPPTIAALVADEGSVCATQVARLCGAGATRRDLADAVHAMCVVHGAHPGLIEIAHVREAAPPLGPWLAEAASLFEGERAALARLTAAVGPLPSTPRQAQAEAAIAGQRHALEMLARSDRAGCAVGAAVALALDWSAVRCVLDGAARQLGVEIPAFAGIAAPAAPADRAQLFGARQLLSQQRNLWSLLESRAAARDAA